MSEIKLIHRFVVILQRFIDVGVLYFALYSCPVVTDVKRFAIQVAVLLTAVRRLNSDVSVRD